MGESDSTVSDRIQSRLESFTRAERQLALSILDGYPVSGLGPLAALAEAAGVSIPTVARTVQKLGFGGYPEFQAALREELKATARGPVAKHESWAEAAPSGHLLNRFTDAVMENIRLTLAGIDPALFDRAADLLGDPAHRLHIVGGRITHVLAEYLYLQMQVMRPDVVRIETTSNTWPHTLLDTRAGDVFCILDVRRYEANTLRLAEMARARGARIVLFTDQWRSPVHALGEVSFATRIVAPSAWDSMAAPLLLIETLIAAAQNRDWDGTKDRMERLEEMFDRTGLFRKFGP